MGGGIIEPMGGQAARNNGETGGRRPEKEGEEGVQCCYLGKKDSCKESGRKRGELVRRYLYGMGTKSKRTADVNDR